jgi:putative cell wall-binding protein
MPIINLRRVGLATLATSLVFGGSVVAAGSASAEARFDFQRLEGENRYATSVAAAAEFGEADTVILASGETGRFPDALTANYLAGLKGAPILLTRQNETPEEVKKAISDAGAENVIIVGGTDVVSQEQENSLKGTYSVRRLAGDNRYDTAAAVIDDGGLAKGDTALLATGVKFPDALGAGPVAFAEDMPLAITRPDDAPDNVVRALDEAGIKKVLVLGGKDAISEAVITELENKGITLDERFDGVDRAATSALFAEEAIERFGFSDSAVNVASGYNKGGGADALSGGPVTGQDERAMLITRSETTVGDGVLTFLEEHSDTLTEGVIFGGESALSKAAEYAMEKAVLGSGAQNAGTGELYDDVQSALADAKAGDTIHVFGEDNDGFNVTTDEITVKGEDGAAVTSGISINGADDVTIEGLSITPSNIGGEVAGVYLNDVDGAVVKDNVIVGNGSGRGVINAIGGQDETATISGNKITDVGSGVYANPSADFTVDSNEFRRTAAGVAAEAKTVVTNNRFIANDEGVGLTAFGSTVTGNYFANNDPHHVKDYSGTPGEGETPYDLEQMIEDNNFNVAVEVDETERAIVDKN